MDIDKLLSKYDYKYPEKLIATEPVHPRDSAKLLVYDKKTKKISFDIFRNLGKYLPKKSVLVFNNTKVLPARITVTKETGGHVHLLYISHNKNQVTALSDKPLKPEMKLFLDGKHLLTTKTKSASGWILDLNLTAVKFRGILKKYGMMPLPPYLVKRTHLTKQELEKEYQTVFALKEGSVAAPTASLHFTKSLINKLEKSGIEICYATLHVGLGTFASLTEDNLKNKSLHIENYSIDKITAKKLLKLKSQGYRIIPVGTTALRTLETAFGRNQLSGATDLFIQEGYEFKFADGLITNFHVPKSSLIMLVSTLIGRMKTLELYNLAIRKKFRLFSFGDGMLVK